MGRRFLAYVINKLIYLIPVAWLTFIIYDKFFWGLLNFSNTYEGFDIFIVIPTSILLNVGTYLFHSFFFDQSIFLVLLSAILANIILDFLLSLFFSIDLGGKVLGFGLVTMKAKKVTIIRLFIRCVVKYLSIAFFPPILLLAFLNQDRLFLHELISGLYKE